MKAVSRRFKAPKRGGSMATACIAHSALRVHGISKPIIAKFDQPQASSDGGALLLKAVDDRLGLTWRLASALRDRRRSSRISLSRPDEGRRHRPLRIPVLLVRAGPEDPVH